MVRLSREFGEYGPEDPQTRRVYESLDHPKLWLPLCDPLRRIPNPHYDPTEFSAFRFWDPLVFGRRAISFDRHDRPVLRRCGSRRAKLLTRSRHAQEVQVGGGFITWLELHPDTDRGSVVAFRVATERLRRWRIPGPPNGNVRVAHTRRRLFIDKIGESGGRASRRYSVMLRP